MDVYELLLGAVPVAVLVGLTVQAVKVFGFATSENLPRVAIGAGLVFGVFSAASTLVPAAASYISLGAEALAGALIAGLGYEYFLAPVAEKFGISIRSSDLE